MSKAGGSKKGRPVFFRTCFVGKENRYCSRVRTFFGRITPVNKTLDRRLSFSIDLPLASSKLSSWIYNDEHTRSNLRNNLGRNLFLEPYRRPKDLIYVETGG